jgi:N-acetylmuramoyl-L-alanine amidase
MELSLDQQAWALCLWREARGEGREGMRAVAWVIHNRSVRWNQRILKVVLAVNQFTSMSHLKQDEQGNWNFEFPSEANEDAVDWQRWKEAQEIVQAIESGEDTSDPTDGALYYANLHTATSGWFFQHIASDIHEHPQTAKLGNHTFFA